VRGEMMTERTDEIQASGRAGAVSAGRGVPKNTNPQPLHAYLMFHHNHTLGEFPSIKSHKTFSGHIASKKKI